ncbi:MAG: SGNH/GDSL hydrolase family protein, partial [Thermoguttaceae bacterium]
ARPAELLARTRTCQLLHRLWRSGAAGGGEAAEAGRPVLPDEVDAMLEYRGGLERYHRDEKWRRDIVDHYRYNLRRMVAMARQAGVPVLLVNPVCNLRDCPPFKNQHRDGLTAEELQRWQSLVTQAGELAAKNSAESVRLLEEALRIDDRHAGLRFMLAKTYDAMGDRARARQEYIAAKENDVCPLRILEAMNQAVLETAADTGSPLVDVRRMYDEISEGGIPGNMYLVDHVHPSIEGHQLIADLIASKLSLMGVVHPRPDWRERRNKAFRAQLDSLTDLYFARGQQRLDALRCWTQGKAGTEWIYQNGEPVFVGEPTKPQ